MLPYANAGTRPHLSCADARLTLGKGFISEGQCHRLGEPDSYKGLKTVLWD